MKKILPLLLLLSACGHSSPPASIASIAQATGNWHNSKQDFISYKDDEIQVGATPYNGGKNIPQFKDEFFVFLEMMVEVPGYVFDPAKVRLQIGGKSYQAEGYDCKPPAPVEGKAGRRKTGKFEFSDQYNCVWLRFPLPPPPVDQEFSMQVDGLTFHDQPLAIPPISFKKGEQKSMLGFF